MNNKNIINALEKNNYQVSFFNTQTEAIHYLQNEIKDEVIGFGDSKTMSDMHLNEFLSINNHVIDPKSAKNNDEFLSIAKECLTTDIFLTSVNAITEDGIIVNLDGTGNRVAGSIFGHKKVYYIVGVNKITHNLEEAIWRVRNIAAPQNAKRLDLRTPCAIKCDKCYNCSSPDRICNGLLIEYKKMNDMDMEVILINESLGF